MGSSAAAPELLTISAAPEARAVRELPHGPEGRLQTPQAEPAQYLLRAMSEEDDSQRHSYRRLNRAGSVESKCRKIMLLIRPRGRGDVCNFRLLLH
jgi:hypothetical protein